MSVHLTRIYTRTGDDGSTGLADFSRVAKTSRRVGAIGDCDETNAAIGLVHALGDPPTEVRAVLSRAQNELFDLGADLAVPVGAETATTPLRITADYVGRLERDCDRFNGELSALRSFVLPGGTPTSAALHLARTSARRAERSVWALIEEDPAATGPLPARYLNRLADLLFILGRTCNPGGDVTWVPGADRPDAVR